MQRLAVGHTTFVSLELTGACQFPPTDAQHALDSSDTRPARWRRQKGAKGLFVSSPTRAPGRGSCPVRSPHLHPERQISTKVRGANAGFCPAWRLFFCSTRGTTGRYDLIAYADEGVPNACLAGGRWCYNAREAQVQCQPPRICCYVRDEIWRL